jgi:hypothetical protein
MKKLLGLKPLWAFGIFILLDVVCIGMGMGVPIFCILLGFPVGWYLVRYITATTTSIPQVFRKVLFYSMITASVTLLGMIIIWGPTISILFEPGRDLANTGVPMILYEPRASFIGWIVLMILISPILQFLTTLFGSYLTLLSWIDKETVIH